MVRWIFESYLNVMGAYVITKMLNDHMVSTISSVMVLDRDTLLHRRQHLFVRFSRMESVILLANFLLQNLR